MHSRQVASLVSHHLLLSHGLALQALRAEGITAKLGIVLNQSPIYPRTASASDASKARLDDGLLIRWYMDALMRGEYPVDILKHLGADAPVIKDGDMSTIQTPLDFIGINYYSRNMTGETPLGADRSEQNVTDIGWEIYPAGLTDLLLRLDCDYSMPPIYITENGAAFSDPVEQSRIHDSRRISYLEQHIQAVRTAMSKGVDVRGYFVWSLFDNFEWAHGYSQRFGLVHVDYETQKRTPKDSAYWFRDFIAAQGQTIKSLGITLEE